MKHLIFDFDGTLFETESFFLDCLSYALEPFGRSASWDFLEEVRSEHPYRIFDQALGPKDAKVAMDRMIEAGQRVTEKIKPYPGIKEMLEELSAQSKKLFIWTGRDEASTHRILKNTECDHFFTEVVTGTCVAKNKPAPDGLLKIAEVTKMDMNQFIMIGDHHHDIDPAKELGCKTVHACWKKNPNHLEREAHKKFETVADFMNWLRSL